MSLGLAVLTVLEDALAREGRYPQAFELLATRQGAILARFHNGAIVEVLAAARRRHYCD